MCIVIDPGAFPPIFGDDNKRHQQFVAVRQWILNGRGCVYYGGTMFLEQIAKTPRSMKLLRLLREQGLAVLLNRDKLREHETDPEFDDPHLIAMCTKSKSRLICTQDKRATKFLVRRDMYPYRFKVPLIYLGAGDAPKLENRYVLEKCTRGARVPKKLDQLFRLPERRRS